MTESKSTVSMVIRIVLLLILAALIVAFLLDRRARAQYETAQETLSKMVDRIAVSPDKVHEALGREPNREPEKEQGYQVEQFSWTSGLPWRSYNLFVCYADAGGTTLYSYATTRNALNLPVTK